jgi:hypothetical protein
MRSGDLTDAVGACQDATRFLFVGSRGHSIIGGDPTRGGELMAKGTGMRKEKKNPKKKK